MRIERDDASYLQTTTKITSLFVCLFSFFSASLPRAANMTTFMKVTVENLETREKFVVKVSSLPFSVGSDSKNTIVLRFAFFFDCVRDQSLIIIYRDDPDILPHHFHIVGVRLSISFRWRSLNLQKPHAPSKQVCS